MRAALRNSDRNMKKSQAGRSDKTIPVTVGYVVGETEYQNIVNICALSTPRSIYIACLKDFARKSGDKVLAPIYDDDNDDSTRSNIDLRIIVTDSIIDVLREQSLYLRECCTREKVAAMFL